MTIEISASPRPTIPCENPDVSMRLRIFRENLVRLVTKKSAYDRNDATLQALFQNNDQSIEKQCDVLARYIAEAFDHYAAWDYSHAYYPGRPSQQTARTDALEGTSRVIPVLAAWLHFQFEKQVETQFEKRPDKPSDKQGELVTLSGQKLNISEILKSAFLAGTNPNHRGYWGKLESYDQKICESADLALALWISRDWVWNTFTDDERKQVIDWFLQVNPLSTVDNNWHLFPLTVQVVVKSLTGIDHVDHNKYQRVKEFYVGEGWFRDGARGNYDYYNAWGFHYSLYWLDQMDPDFDRDFIHTSMSAFVSTYRHFLTPSGIAFFGRSACYRLAVSAPLLALLDIERDIESDKESRSITAGEAQRALATSLRYFIGNGAMRFGAPTQGVFSEDSRLVDNYSGPASSFWSMRALVVALYSGHRTGLWNAEPEPLPVEMADFQFDIPAIEAKVLGVQKTGEVSVIFTSDYTQEQSPESRRLEAQSPIKHLVEIITGRAERPKNNLLRKGITCYSSKMAHFF